MSLHSDIERYLNEQYIKKIEKKLIPVYEKAGKNFFKTVKNKLENMYESTIDEFYRDYTPDFYERRGSLYNLLDIMVSDDELSWSFDPSKISYRNNRQGAEDGLYDLVFRQGYHGGSKSDKNGTHPNLGVPYWRTPYPKFSQWGKQATKAETSPLERFKEKISIYENNGEYQDDFDTLVSAKLNKAVSDMWR